MSRQAILYTREGCHLCETARDVLLAHGLRVTMIDIDGDPALQKQYDVCVPVVVIDGQERFRGRVDPRLLERLLTGTTAHNNSAAPDAQQSTPRAPWRLARQTRSGRE